MDRKSLVASLRNFRQNLIRQRDLKLSLSDLQEERDKYKRGSKQPLKKECDTAPEKAGFNDTNLAKYDKKNEPRLPKGMEEKDGKDPTFMDSKLFYIVMAIFSAILTVIYDIKLTLRGTFEDLAATIFGGIILFFVVMFILVIIFSIIVVILVDPIILAIYPKRKKEYYIKHKQARAEAYQKDLDEKYASDKKHADEMSQKLSEAELAIVYTSSELDAVNKVVAEYDILPEKYKTLDAVEHISDYIRDMRADSIKEAINLYAYETSERSHRSRLMWEAHLQTEAMQNAADAAWRTADEQARTARAQERAADEAEKRRKAAEETLDKVKDIKDILDS